MPTYPFAVKVYKAFDGTTPIVGIDTLTMPNVRMAQGTISGAGVTATSIPKIIPGVVEPMDGGSLNWHASCQAAFNLFDGNPHSLTIYTDILQEDSSNGTDIEIAEKCVLRATVAGYNLGTRSNTTKANVVQPILVDYLALYFGGNPLWFIDPANGVCILNGVDQNAFANSMGS
jgi:phage tail tube protein FII